MNKIIKVYSHPRSGTNFLLSVLKNNFYSNLNISIPNKGTWGHWSNRKSISGTPGILDFGKISGDHRVPERSKPALPCIYIYRDGRSVALSVWKSDNFLNKEMKAMSFSKYLNTKLDWIETPGKKSERVMNIIEHWVWHTNSWIKFEEENRGSVYLIRYEDLLLQPDVEVKKLANFFNLEFNKDIISKEYKHVGPSPNFTKKADHLEKWKDVFTEKDLKLFYSVVDKDYLCCYK